MRWPHLLANVDKNERLLALTYYKRVMIDMSN